MYGAELTLEQISSGQLARPALAEGFSLFTLRRVAALCRPA